MSRRYVAGLALVSLLVGPALAGCGDDGDGPGAASSCEELVHEGAQVARDLVRQFDGAGVDALDPGTADDPFPQLTQPFAPFGERAAELGCDEGELRRLACDAYQGIEPTGPAMEEFLAAIDQICR